MPAIDINRDYTLNDAVQVAGVSRSRLAVACQRGELPHRKQKCQRSRTRWEYVVSGIDLFRFVREAK